MRSHCTRGSMTTWKGTTMEATSVMKIRVDHQVLLRTRIHAAMEENSTITARLAIVMTALSRKALK